MNNNRSISRLIKLSLKNSFKNIWRNRTLSLTTIFVTATILFIFNIILGINQITDNALSTLNQKIDVVVYLKQSTTYKETQKIVNDLKQIPGIKEINYTSSQQALENLENSHPDLFIAFEQFNLQNPLPASLDIKTTHPTYHQAIADFLKQDQYLPLLNNIQSGNNQDNSILNNVSDNLIKLTSFTEQVIFWLIITFVLGGSLIIINALQINIFARKQEIAVMQIVGASKWFIRAPFMIEGALYGISALILSAIMLTLFKNNLNLEGSTVAQLYNNINIVKIFIYEGLITIIIGTISAIVATEEYLRQDHIST